MILLERDLLMGGWWLGTGVQLASNCENTWHCEQRDITLFICMFYCRWRDNA